MLDKQYDNHIYWWRAHLTAERLAPRTISFYCETIHAVATILDRCGRPYMPREIRPEEFIFWEKAGRLHPYSEEGYGLDKVVTIPLSDRLGFRFSNHTLRRTFGRVLFRAGVEVATIAKILGHESTEVTLRYIGVDLDDMRGAMAINPFRKSSGDNETCI